MRCPQCGSKLQRNDISGVITFRCPGGCGQYLTFAALRALHVESDNVNALWRNAKNGNYIAGVHCPSCNLPMRQLKIGTGSISFDLDICPVCTALWFDKGELEQIPVKIPAIADELPQRAKEIMALHQIETIAEQNHDLDGGNNTPDANWKFLPLILGLPVEKDSIQRRRLPLITWFLAAVCLAFYGYAEFSDTHTLLLRQWGFIPAQWDRLYGLTIFSSMFLHGGPGHLLGNIYFLLLFGDNVEDKFGAGRYILLILLSGVCAAIFYMLTAVQTGIPCVGASGFISGIIAAYAIMFPKAKLVFLLTCRFLVCRLIAIPAFFAAALWFIYQLLMFRYAPNSQTAFAAHIGGFIPGIVYALCEKIRNCRNQA